MMGNVDRGYTTYFLFPPTFHGVINTAYEIICKKVLWYNTQKDHNPKQD
jgi:hypothetical protein